MERRTFIKNTSLFAIAISTTGFVHFDGNHYIGDCETTTDVLGPFYRPESPIRKNLAIIGESGESIELSGRINHKDCTTPYKNAKIELWHCDAKGVYDNSSDQFRYRGTTFSDANGKYSFQTILPVPYDIGNGNFRPAHFHMMVSADGYQPLVTQLYFVGDAHIDKDESSSSPTAKKRILKVESLKTGTKKVVFNVSMSEKLSPESTAIDRLIGMYIDEKKSENKEEFFKKDNQLWVKNELFGLNLDYIGSNTFQLPGTPLKFQFELLLSGSTKLAVSSENEKGNLETQVLIKEKK